MYKLIFFLGTDNDSLNEDNSLESVKGIFTEIKNSIGIPQINNEDNSGDESGNYIYYKIN